MINIIRREIDVEESLKQKLSVTLKDIDNELIEENSSLKQMLQQWKSKFFSISYFLTDRIVKSKNRENTLNLQRIYILIRQ